MISLGVLLLIQSVFCLVEALLLSLYACRFVAWLYWEGIALYVLAAIIFIWSIAELVQGIRRFRRKREREAQIAFKNDKRNKAQTGKQKGGNWTIYTGEIKKNGVKAVSNPSKITPQKSGTKAKRAGKRG